MSEWFHDESFWVDFYPFMFPQERFDAAGEQVEKILALCNVESGHVLDLCCGPGRHTTELARRGFTVIGVDLTTFLLDKARARAEAEGLKVEWVQDSMLDFVRPGAFDLILSMFTSFGFFDDKSDDLKVLRNMYESLKPGGVALIDVMGKERFARICQPTTTSELPDGSLVVQRHEIFDDWTRIRNEWILIRDGEAKSHKFHHTLYSGQELKDRLLQAGLPQVKLYGSLDGIPYDTEATRLIAVARRDR